MKLKDAISRVRFTISKSNKPNQTDVEAFNMILEHFQKTQEKTIQDNLLFAKLYTYLLSEFCRHYTDIDFANQELNKLLDQTMDNHVFVLLQKLKEMELRKFFLRADVRDTFLKNQTFDELEKTADRYKDKLEGLTSEGLLHSLENWDEDFVIGHLNRNINLSIQKFKNNV